MEKVVALPPDEQDAIATRCHLVTCSKCSRAFKRATGAHRRGLAENSFGSWLGTSTLSATFDC
jgi:hypothetical protein